MTVCVGVKVQDCIVFAADSTTSMQATTANGEQMTVNTYDHANKLFNLCKGLPIAAMTAGIGNFGTSSISTVAKDFRSLLQSNNSEYYLDPATYTMEEVAEKARKYFYEERFSSLDVKPSGSFQFWIGGYSAGADLGEIWQVVIDQGNCGPAQCTAPKDQPAGLAWGGAPDAINRLVLGYSSAIGDALLAGGVPKDAVQSSIAAIGQYTQADLLNPAMPTTDAIDLARFLAETTKQFVRFCPGSNSVGGSIDIATVTKHENFKWAARKHFYNRTLNPLETDHV